MTTAEQGEAAHGSPLAQDEKAVMTTDHHGYISDEDAYLNRMSRIEGQARGISKMIDDEKYCIDILT